MVWSHSTGDYVNGEEEMNEEAKAMVVIALASFVTYLK